MPKAAVPLRERLLAKAVVDLDGPATVDGSPCWTWTGSLNGSGYGQLGKGPHGAGAITAHRAAYELWYGPVPAGYQLDHLCRNRVCCNPAHLEAVTPRENTLRSEGPAAVNAVKVACPRGHPYDAVYSGHRYCKICERDKMRRRRAAAKVVNQDISGGKCP